MSIPDSLIIRPVLAGEAAVYARNAAEAFFEAYHDGSDAGNMRLHLEREFGEEQQRRELLDPAVTVLASRAPDGSWAGFVAMRAGSLATGVTARRPLEIVRFYLRRPWYGRGAARPLMDAALAHAREAGHDGVWLQVWEHNARARRFYEKCGFRAVGTNPFLFGAIPEDDVVYQLSFEACSGAG